MLICTVTGICVLLLAFIGGIGWQRAITRLALTANGRIGDETCCGNIFGGMCSDGSIGSPCCGKGRCNVLCCDCSGGCAERDLQANLPVTEPKHLQIPIRQWPIIIAHDAATTYAKHDTCGHIHPVNNYAVTQSRGTFKDLLNCGARALDFRPWLADDGKLLLHHGKIVFETAAEEALNHTVEWANDHPGELVLVMAGHCKGGSNCGKEALKLLQAQHINHLHDGDISKWTLGEAMEHGKLPGGGSTLWVDVSQVEGHYTHDVACYDILHHLSSRRLTNANISDTAEDGRQLAGILGHLFRGGTCYGSEDERSHAFSVLWEYFDSTANPTEPPAEDKLWNLQAHWQYDEKQIIEGEARSSCILQEERWSEINRRVAEHIREGDHQLINLLEVDYVCDHGQDIYLALREHASRKVESMNIVSEFNAQTSMGYPQATAVRVSDAVFALGTMAMAFAAAAVATRCARQAPQRLMRGEFEDALECNE